MTVIPDETSEITEAKYRYKFESFEALKKEV